MTAFNTGALTSVTSSEASTDKRGYEPSMEEILASIRRIIADDQSLPGRGTADRADSTSGEPPAAPGRTPIAQTPPEAPPRQEPAVAVPPHSRQTHPPVQSAPAPPPPQSPLPPLGQPGPASAAALRPTQLAHGTIAAPQYPMPDRGRDEDLGEAPSPVDSEAPVTFDAETDAADHERSFHAGGSQEPALADGDPTFDAPLEPHVEPAADASTLFSAATDTSVSSAFNMLAASRLADNSDELMNLVREMIRPLLRNWLDDNLPSMVERMVRAEIERVARGGR